MVQDGDNSGKPYGGFDLRKVSWGYQQIFAETLDRLAADGTIRPGRDRSSRAFFEILNRAAPGSFDHVVKEFLGALNPATRWLVGIPGVFEDLCELGWEISEQRLSHGIAFFRTWGRGGFGDRPDQVSALLRHVRTLRQVDGQLAQAFMASYRRLLDRLSGEQVQVFANWVRDLHARNRRTAIDCAALRLKSAITFLDNLSQESRLEDIQYRLGRLVRAISGRTVEVGDFGMLDSDSLIMRNSKLVCFRNHLFLPVKMRVRKRRCENESLYLLAGLVSAAAIRWGSFPAVHGGEGAGEITEWVGGDPLHAGLVTLIEMVRVLDGLRRRLPGARRLIDLGIECEFSLLPPRSATDALMHALLTGRDGADAALAAAIRKAAAQSHDCRQTADLARPLRDRYAAVADADPRAVLLLPDFYFPAEMSIPPASALVADQKQKVRREARPDAGGDDRGTARPEDEEKHKGELIRAGFVYPEWNQQENDYYEDWCILREHFPQPHPRLRDRSDAAQDAGVRRARRMFERLKPELMRKEKFLAYGDEINIDRLVAFIAQKHEHPAPRVDFYEKKYVKKRDLVAALLLDVSGSTANEPGGGPATPHAAGPTRRIIDIEKRAAMILGEGLSALGDPFGIYGFSGSGREQCDFYVYKEIADPFSDPARARLMAAFPAASTRIGVALRHTRSKLEAHPARRKLILLITDGKPQDSDYDPATRYAQYDVRMACHECARKDIHVVCISTLANSRADLEIMFPQRRFVILEDMSQLVDILPRLYLKMTT